MFTTTNSSHLGIHWQMNEENAAYTYNSALQWKILPHTKIRMKPEDIMLSKMS